MRISGLFTITVFFFLSCQSISSQIIRVPLKKSEKEKPNLRKDVVHFSSRTGSINIQNYYNLNYIASIQIGPSNQEFNVVLDTGSANLWVPDASLRAKNQFDCSVSPTCLSSKSPGYMSLYYGQGDVRGYRMKETLNLGGLMIPDYDMMLAVDVNSIHLNNFDGILGLSLGKLHSDFPTILERLENNGLINTTTFSMYLGDDPTAVGGNTGEIIFGGYDPQYALSEFQFVKVRTEKETLYWLTDMLALGYGDKVNMTKITLPVIFDSGTSFLLLPGDIVQGIVSQAQQQGIFCDFLPFQNQYICDCRASHVLNDLVFYFDDVTLNIPATSYILNDFGTCFLAIQSMPAPPSLTNPIILGDVLLKNFYTMYSANNYTVGFAKAAPVKHFPVWIVLLLLLAIIVIIILIVNRREKQRNTNGLYRAFNNGGIVIGGGRRQVPLIQQNQVLENEGQRNL